MARKSRKLNPASGVAQTVWTHPNAAPSLLSVRWNPGRDSNVWLHQRPRDLLLAP